MANFQKKTGTAKTAGKKWKENHVGEGEAIEQVLTSSCPPKKYLAQPKGGEKFPCPRN